MPPTFAASPKCAFCNTSVYFAEQTIGPAGKIYHKPCLKCMTCKKTLEPRALLDHDGEPYCKPCHGKAFGTRGYGVGGALVADYHDPLLSNKTSQPRASEISITSSKDPSASENGRASPFPKESNAPPFAPRASLPNPPRPTVPPKPTLGARASVAAPGGRTLGDVCPRCQTTVYAAEQVLAAGSKWHKRCLRCAGCSTALASGQLTEKDGEPWCRNCYANKFGHLAHGLMSVSTRPLRGAALQANRWSERCWKVDR